MLISEIIDLDTLLYSNYKCLKCIGGIVLETTCPLHNNTNLILPLASFVLYLRSSSLLIELDDAITPQLFCYDGAKDPAQ